MAEEQREILRCVQRYVDEDPQFKELVSGRGYKAEPFAHGEYNVNILLKPEEEGDKYLLRYAAGSQMDLHRQTAYEFNALREIHPTGRVPEVYILNEKRNVLPSDFLIMEYLPGRPLDYRTDLTIAAEILSDIHSLEVSENTSIIQSGDTVSEILEESGRMLDKSRKSPWKDEGLIEYVGSAMESAHGMKGKFAGRTPRRSYINTELNSGNFLINEGKRSYLVDWEKPLIGDPLQDIAHFLAPTTTYWKTDIILDGKDIDLFLDEYSRRIPLSADDREYLEFLMGITCFRGITWCAMAYGEYMSDRAIRNEDTFLRIRDYLREEFYTGHLAVFR